MHIKFKKLIMHNFLSFGHSEIDLNDRGYCLVEGINQFKKDNAKSNGSGKSTWVSAICWTLLGETIQGVSSVKDIKNIYISEDECWVSLSFSIDKDEYLITRYNRPKSDLKIILNGNDISGKGIKDSEQIMLSYLPDINKDLISSVILLGQGLPNKLSSHTPSGRKEMLEKLSKSDFMIEDIKNRVDNRSKELSNEINNYNNKQIELNSKIEIYKTRKVGLENKLQSSSINYDFVISEKEKENKSIESNIAQLNDSLVDNRNKLSALNEAELESIKLKQEMLLTLTQKFNSNKDLLVESKTNLQIQKNSLEREILTLESIKDVCPTCGQKIPNVVKQDTTTQHQKLEEINKELNSISTQLEGNDKKYHEDKLAIESTYSIDTKAKEDLKGKIASSEVTLNTLNNEHNALLDVLNKLKQERDNHNNLIKMVSEELQLVTTNINDLSSQLDEVNKKLENLLEHQEMVKKLDTLIKRDFRGYLLGNVINYIDLKAKEYSKYVFDSSEIDFKLNGNNIDIMYCNKPFECLSGGEKQRVDIVLQFAIRDMMSRYLDFSTNLLCLDEIFDNLDSKSTNSILNLISNVLSDVESLFIISHHSTELQIPYDTTLRVIKNSYGISEVR